MCKNHNHNHIRKIFKFEDFINESKVVKLLMEGKLTASDRFLKKLSSIRSNPVADKLYNAFLDNTLIDKDLSQNWVDVSDKEDVVTFMGDRGADRLGNNPESIFSANRNEIKVGRFARTILTELGETVQDKDIEVFVNTYKASKEDTTKRFEMVSGKAIRKYYSEDSYASKKGTLGDSCMRYDSCDTYFKIYTKNPDECQLLVYLDENGDVLGRALVWKLKKKKLFNIKDQSRFECPAVYFMDRVYTASDSDVVKFTNLAKERGWLYKWKMTADIEEGLVFRYNNQIVFGQIKVELDKVDFKEYPFFDTLSFCDGHSYISNVGFKSDDQFTMCSTEGESDPCNSCDGSGYDNDPSDDCRICNGDGDMDCPNCHGDGKEDCKKCEGGEVSCKKCDGRGCYDCDNCDQHGEVSCPDCKGEGYNECLLCNGSGSKGPCPKCKGEGDNCRLCNGTGEERCPSCYNKQGSFSRGNIECGECDGSGNVVCVKCHGNSTIECETCGGEGNIGSCKNCNGTGYIGDCKNKSCEDGKVICLLCSGKGKNLRTGKILCPACAGLLDTFKEDLKCGIFQI